MFVSHVASDVSSMMKEVAEVAVPHTPVTDGRELCDTANVRNRSEPLTLSHNIGTSIEGLQPDWHK